MLDSETVATRNDDDIKIYMIVTTATITIRPKAQHNQPANTISNADVCITDVRKRQSQWKCHIRQPVTRPGFTAAIPFQVTPAHLT